MTKPRAAAQGPVHFGDDLDNLANATSAPASQTTDIYVVFRPQPGVDPYRALRGLLKIALRKFGLRCLRIEADTEAAQ